MGNPFRLSPLVNFLVFVHFQILLENQLACARPLLEHYKLPTVVLLSSVLSLPFEELEIQMMKSTNTLLKNKEQDSQLFPFIPCKSMNFSNSSNDSCSQAESRIGLNLQKFGLTTPMEEISSTRPLSI